MMWCEIEHLFTFQYVSINTDELQTKGAVLQKNLHSNMFLLIQVITFKTFDRI